MFLVKFRRNKKMSRENTFESSLPSGIR